MFRRQQPTVVKMPRAMTKAIEDGDLELVKKLIAKHAGDTPFLNAMDRDGNTALLKSLRLNHPEIAEFLLSCPAIDINTVVWDKNTRNGNNRYRFIPVTLAMKKRYLNLVDIMLQNPTLHVNAYSYHGFTVLEFACAREEQHYVKKLLCHPKLNLSWVDDMPDNIIKWVYQHLSRTSFNKMVSLQNVTLLVYGNDPTEHKLFKFSYHLAHILSELLKLPDFYIDDSLILLVARTGQVELLQALLNDPRFNWQTRYVDGKNLLMLAAEQSMPELVNILLQTKKFDVNAQDDHGNTALILAAMRHEDAMVVNSLLAAGADRTIMNKRGRNAVMEASGAGHHALSPRIQIAPISAEEYQQFLVWRQQQTQIINAGQHEFSPNPSRFKQEI